MSAKFKDASKSNDDSVSKELLFEVLGSQSNLIERIKQRIDSKEINISSEAVVKEVRKV